MACFLCTCTATGTATAFILCQSVKVAGDTVFLTIKSCNGFGDMRLSLPYKSISENTMQLTVKCVSL